MKLTPDERRDITITNGVLRVCCADRANLVRQAPDPRKPGVTLRVCKICERKHIEMSVDPGRIGITLR